MKDRGQYLLAFGVVASMLLVAGFPLFVIFFFGIFAYFLLRMFASGSRSETREIFEFYLTANEMLRDDSPGRLESEHCGVQVAYDGLEVRV